MYWLSCIISNVLLATLVALAAYFVQKHLRQYAVARVLWLLALVKLITPSLVSVPLGTSTGAAACVLGLCGCAQHASPFSMVWLALPWALLAVWSVGAVATAGSAWCRWTRFQRLLSHAYPAPPQWQSLAARIAADLSLRRVPDILAVPGRLPPLVVPHWQRPRVLLPIGMIDQLSGPQRTALLLHEMLHIKRGDHLVRVLELIVGVAFWWLPMVGSIGRQLRACEEACCDAAVVARLPKARREYARLLLVVLDFASPLPRSSLAQTTAMSTADDLEHRLCTILKPSAPRRRTALVAIFALLLACTILPCRVHYDPLARAAQNGPAAGASNLPSDACPPVVLPSLICPS